MELPNGVSGINGKRWMSMSLKERWVSNVNEREVGEVNDPQPYLTVRITAQEKPAVCLIECPVSPRCKYIIDLQANVS